jgi:leucine-rich repeat protein SHOC2
MKRIITSLIILFVIILNFNGKIVYTSLIFSKNQDTSYYNSITWLDLSQRNLTELPSDLKFYKNLEYLDLSANPIVQFDSSLLQLKKLRTIKLNHCPYIDIRNAADVFVQMPIKHLELQSCYLTYIPSKLYLCDSLSKLDVKDNFLSYFPEEIAYYGRLNWVDVSNNKIDTLAELFGAMRSLNYLDLSNNNCLNYNRTVGIISGLTNLETLKINGAGFLSDSLDELSNLKELELQNATILKWPNGLRLSHIKKLNLNGSDSLNYNTVFVGLSKCDSLETLLLSSKDIKTLGSNFSLIKSMKTLVIGENSLTQFPDNFSKLTQLREMTISFENMASANSFFREMNPNALEKLDISYSKITRLPPSIERFKNLKELNLEGIHLDNLPTQLTTLSQLQLLNLKNTNVLEQGITAIKNALPTCDVISDVECMVPENLKRELYASQETYTLNNSVANILTTKDGSIIEIPANSFVDEQGKMVTKNVNVSFKPFYTPSDIYLSGINMNYDSAGSSHSFISAGMFDITAQANGKELKLAKQKNINIDFASYASTTTFNYYKYDRVNKSWAYTGNDSAKKKRIKSVKKVDSLSELNALPVSSSVPLFLSRPSLPKAYFNQLTTQIHYKVVPKSKQKLITFYIQRGFTDNKIEDEVNPYFNRKHQWLYEADTNEIGTFLYEKLKDKKWLTRESKKNKRSKKPDYYLSSRFSMNIEIDVRPNRLKDKFDIVIKYNNDSLVFQAYPNYNLAAAKVQEKTKRDYEKYLAEKKTREAQENIKLAKYRAELKTYEAAMDNYMANIRKANTEELKNIENKTINTDLISRTLQLNELGVWNCDIINRLQNGTEIFVKLYDENNHLRTPKSITIIDKTNNGFGSFKSSKVIVSRYVNTILIAQLGDDTYGYVKFNVCDKNARNIQLSISTLDTKKMKMKEFTDKVLL